MTDLIDTPSRMELATFSWPDARTVARMPGSLPMGGVVPGTPIHAFSATPAALRFQTTTRLSPCRKDIAIGGQLAFLIEDVVTHGEADAIVAASEVFGYLPEAPGITTPPGMRMNKAVHWVADDAMLGPIFQRIAHLLPKEIDGALLHHRFSHRINMYRYDDQDVFNRHIDGDWPGFGLNESRDEMIQWSPLLHSRLSMLLYLNGPEEGVQGGQTILLGHRGERVDVTPKKGAALFFRHGFTADSVSHIGARVNGRVPKYLARINVMYDQSAPG